MAGAENTAGDPRRWRTMDCWSKFDASSAGHPKRMDIKRLTHIVALAEKRNAARTAEPAGLTQRAVAP